MTTLLWFRQDLRLGDNPALHHAAARGDILPVYILDDACQPVGEAAQWWLHHSLAALAKDLGRLVFRRGPAAEILPQLVREAGAEAVYWNRCYDPASIQRDSRIKEMLAAQGLEVRSFNGALLHEPWQIETQSGGPFKVYTPYWRAAQKAGFPQPIPKPSDISLSRQCEGDGLERLDLLPTRPNWANGWEKLWMPGEAGAMTRLEDFLGRGLAGYGELRNRPDLPHVSRLSPHLHFGEISPRQIFARLDFHLAEHPQQMADAQTFKAELGWREFSHHLLYHFPKMPSENWRSEFDRYPWREAGDDLVAWQKGQTGYPIVDAGMRELWHTGYMHNRVRMVVASFLIKHLRLHWRHGHDWFVDTLLDADVANNAASWQWVAGSGADASPYFRIFNPITQGRKFDPEGAYIRQWCPELSALPTAYIHAPFEAPPDVLKKSGVHLGRSYPAPIVDHATARKEALAGYQMVKGAKDGQI